MTTDPGIVVIVSVGLSALIALGLVLYAVWHLEAHIQERTRNRDVPPEDIH